MVAGTVTLGTIVGKFRASAMRDIQGGVRGINPREAEMEYVSNGYAVGWGTLALLNAGLAQSKGKSGLLWALLSMVLGPIATLILVAAYADAKR